MRTPLTICLALILAALLSHQATSHEGATGIVKTRMNLMTSLASSMKTLGQMFKGETHYSSNVVAREASDISTKAVEMMAMFPKGSNHHASEATPAVWSNPAGFAEEAQRFKAAADALAGAAADETGARAKYVTLSQTCSACHKDYRTKKH